MQPRWAGLVETGAHAVLAVAMAPYKTGEHTLAKLVVPALTADMLCLADRLFASFSLWQQASQTGAQLLWRVRANYRLPVETALPDGSYLSTLYASTADQRHRTNGVRVRVVLQYLGESSQVRDLPAHDHPAGSRPGTRPRTGRALPGALGDGGRLR